MRILDDYEARTREEDAKIADFRHLASRAAHLALTNRALATAILTVDTNVTALRGYLLLSGQLRAKQDRNRVARCGA